MSVVFHNPVTLMDRQKARGNAPSSISADEFYRKFRLSMPDWRRNREERVACILSMIEQGWINAHRPRYKVHLAHAQMLIDSAMNIPCELFKGPHPSFAISFPQCGLGGMAPAWWLDASSIGSLLVGVVDTEPDHESLWAIQISAYQISAEAPEVAAIIQGYGGESVEQSLSRHDDLMAQKGCKKHLTSLLRLCVGVAMLATSAHRCVQHDVIESLRNRYGRAKTDEERKRIEELSERRSGRREWTIGRDLQLYTPPPGSEPDADGDQLRYQHIRGGHFHTVAYGAGKRLRKVEWYEPTIVRPDLPMKPIEKETAPVTALAQT